MSQLLALNDLRLGLADALAGLDRSSFATLEKILDDDMGIADRLEEMAESDDHKTEAWRLQWAIEEASELVAGLKTLVSVVDEYLRGSP